MAPIFLLMLSKVGSIPLYLGLFNVTSSPGGIFMLDSTSAYLAHPRSDSIPMATEKNELNSTSKITTSNPPITEQTLELVTKETTTTTNEEEGEEEDAYDCIIQSKQIEGS